MLQANQEQTQCWASMRAQLQRGPGIGKILLPAIGEADRDCGCVAGFFPLPIPVPHC